MLTVVGRHFVMPVVVEIALDAGDDAVCFAACQLFAVTEFRDVAKDREPELFGIGNAIGAVFALIVFANAVAVEIRIIVAVIAFDNPAGLVGYERIALRAENFTRRSGRAGEERAAGITLRIGAAVLGLDERHERFADFEVADQVDAIAIQLWRQAELSAGPEVVAIAADKGAERCPANASPGLPRERAVRIEEIRRVSSATVERFPFKVQERALIAVKRVANVLEELRVEHAITAVDGSRWIGVDGDEAIGVAQVRAARPVVIVLVGIFEVDGNVAGAALGAELDAFVVILEDEVDDAGDRVRTVDRRIAAGDDVDPLDEVSRDGVHVRRVGVEQHVARNVAAAVDENQRALRAEAAQIEQVQTGSAEELGRVRLAERAAQGRKVVEGVTDRDAAGFEELFAADRSHRNGGFEVGTTDARTGNDDFLASRKHGRRVVVALRVLARFDFLFAGQRRDRIGRNFGFLCKRRGCHREQQAHRAKRTERCAAQKHPLVHDQFFLR